MFLGVVDRVLNVYSYGYISSVITDPIKEFSRNGDTPVVISHTVNTLNNDTDDDEWFLENLRKYHAVLYEKMYEIINDFWIVNDLECS